MNEKEKMVEAINLDAYLSRCECPICGNKMFHGCQGEEVKYCSKCGQKLHIRAFTREEIDRAVFEKEQDDYED